jgi:sialidase-1
MVATPNGTLLAFCEARKISSTDKTPTDIVVKRSTDNGMTWSGMHFLTHGNQEAFMDPVALVDEVTGTIFLFANRWPANDVSMKENSAWVITSTDDGQSWSEPLNITSEIVAPGHLMNGFGPGSGFQMKGGIYHNRLILPTRQHDGQNLRNRTVYSDDHGKTWHVGEPADVGGEYEITEASPDTLIYTLRAGNGMRKKGWSYDGGISWTPAVEDPQLQTTKLYGGCQSSILSVGDVLLYSGPAGGNPDNMHEDRQNLRIYRCFDKGRSWSDHMLLFDKAAGYSNMAQLPNGDLALIFETADTEGFPRMLPGLRPPGWMRLDVIHLSKDLITSSWAVK